MPLEAIQFAFIHKHFAFSCVALHGPWNSLSHVSAPGKSVTAIKKQRLQQIQQ